MTLRTGRCPWVLLAALAATGCRPQPSTIDLEILDVQPATTGLAAGGVVPVRVQVRNNGRDTAIVCAAVPSPDSATGLIRKGPQLEIRRGRTETLTLDVPAVRPYLHGCTLATTVFLARPGEPPNFARDVWLDPVPNHSRDVSFPVTRPNPASLEVVAPVREIVDQVTQYEFIHHYEATARVLPAGSTWEPIEEVFTQLHNRFGPVELLASTIHLDRLKTGRASWLTTPAARAQRQSIVSATVRAEVVDCAGETIVLLAQRIPVQLAPQ